jgi:hypothetical protein
MFISTGSAPRKYKDWIPKFNKNRSKLDQMSSRKALAYLFGTLLMNDRHPEYNTIDIVIIRLLNDKIKVFPRMEENRLWKTRKQRGQLSVHFHEYLPPNP